MSPTSNELVLRFTRAFDALGISYMLVGSLSSNAYGIPRSTKDADIVLQTDQDIIDRLHELVGAEFTFEPQVSFETVTNTIRHVAEHPTSGFVIELFYLSSDPHDQIRFQRRRRGRLDGVEVWIPSAEDVVVTKLRWSRSGKSRAKDIEDVLDVLDVQRSNLDLAYIRQWSTRHGTLEVFERLWHEINETS